MKKEDFFKLGLPKWPALLVVGEPVSKEQAAEIIIRTDHLDFSSNDGPFDAQINAYLYDVEIPNADYGGLDEAINLKLGIVGRYTDELIAYKNDKEQEVLNIPLDYLNNNRIVSSWIGGPHGWCNWNGAIWCNNYNIGEYPSVEEIYDEWVLIAKAFPFLKLKSQLLSGETGEDDSVPIIEFRINNGKVKMIRPTSKIMSTYSDIGEMVSNFLAPGRERGCTFETFKNAVDLVKSTNKELIK